MTTRLLLLPALAAAAASLWAATTQNWVQNTQEDFDKGTLKGVSLRSDGRLSPAPRTQEVLDAASTYLWTLAEDSKGNIYTAGGGYGSRPKLHRIDPSGKAEIVAEVEGLEIHAVAVSPRDQVFVATAPDSKIYRIDNGKPTQFYDPRAKYVWAMAFNRQGDLFIATGDQGEVHRVSPNGTGSVFFRTDETHARSLALDGAGNVIVGTEPGGLVIRVAPDGKGFVLHQMGKREVTAVAITADGTLYAAAVGNKGTGSGPTTVPIAPSPNPPATSPTPPPNQARPPVTAQPAANALVVSGPTIPGGSEVVRIDRDGAPRTVWTNGQAIVYAMAFDGQGRPLLGTGNVGHVYRLDTDLLSTRLVNLPPTQVTALLAGRNGRLYAATGNIGKVYGIGPELEARGTFESDTLNTSSFTYWGRLVAKMEGEGVTLETRSGNLDRPQTNWSLWATVPNGARIPSPAARFLQYRVTFAPAGNAAASVSQVDIAYLEKNVAPVLSQVEVTPANYRFPPPLAAASATPASSLSLPPVGQRRPAASRAAAPIPGASLQYAKGYTGARWLARDENGDELTYKVEIKGVNEASYRVLQPEVRQPQVSIDTAGMADGEYRLRITATDTSANPPGQALTATLESDPFVVDNTPPQVIGLAGTTSGNQVTAKWRARDGRSLLQKAEVAVNGGEWQRVDPTTRLTDAPEHEYTLTMPRPGPGEVTVAVRATDEYENQTVERVVVK